MYPGSKNKANAGSINLKKNKEISISEESSKASYYSPSIKPTPKYQECCKPALPSNPEHTKFKNADSPTPSNEISSKWISSMHLKYSDN